MCGKEGRSRKGVSRHQELGPTYRLSEFLENLTTTGPGCGLVNLVIERPTPVRIRPKKPQNKKEIISVNVISCIHLYIC